MGIPFTGFVHSILLLQGTGLLPACFIRIMKTLRGGFTCTYMRLADGQRSWWLQRRGPRQLHRARTLSSLTLWLHPHLSKAKTLIHPEQLHPFNHMTDKEERGLKVQTGSVETASHKPCACAPVRPVFQHVRTHPYSQYFMAGDLL